MRPPHRPQTQCLEDQDNCCLQQPSPSFSLTPTKTSPDCGEHRQSLWTEKKQSEGLRHPQYFHILFPVPIIGTPDPNRKDFHLTGKQKVLKIVHLGKRWKQHIHFIGSWLRERAWEKDNWSTKFTVVRSTGTPQCLATCHLLSPRYFYHLKPSTHSSVKDAALVWKLFQCLLLCYNLSSCQYHLPVSTFGLPSAPCKW